LRQSIQSRVSTRSARSPKSEVVLQVLRKAKKSSPLQQEPDQVLKQCHNSILNVLIENILAKYSASQQYFLAQASTSWTFGFKLPRVSIWSYFLSVHFMSPQYFSQRTYVTVVPWQHLSFAHRKLLQQPSSKSTVMSSETDCPTIKDANENPTKPSANTRFTNPLLAHNTIMRVTIIHEVRLHNK
jgi:hypothetical protein